MGYGPSERFANRQPASHRDRNVRQPFEAADQAGDNGTGAKAQGGPSMRGSALSLARSAITFAAERVRDSRNEKMATKKELAALEKIFAAEIENRLPFQSKAKIYPQLSEDGLVAPMTRQFGADRFGPITVKGWQLTHAGRYLYCASCDDVDGE